jgi:hypothetical protein
MIVDAICLRFMRQLVFRRHELITGLDSERGRPPPMTSVTPLGRPVSGALGANRAEAVKESQHNRPTF